jgi:hypothetical protein
VARRGQSIRKALTGGHRIGIVADASDEERGVRMTVPLDRLRALQLTQPGPGEITLGIARHEAPVWPSPEVSAYHNYRAELVDALVSETGVVVTSPGETYEAHPREVVELILAVAPAIVTTVGTVIAAWLSRSKPVKEGVTQHTPTAPPPPPQNAPTLLPGVAIKRHDGQELRIAYTDGLTDAEILNLVSAFLAPAPATAAT